MTSASQIAVGAALALAGAVVLYGAGMRWAWLIDPPESDWPVYSQALLKKLLGRSGLRAATYVQGIALLAAGGVLLASSLG